MKKLVFIETSDIGAAYTARACEKLGFSPLFLCNKKNIFGDTRDQLESECLKGYVIDTDTSSVPFLLKALEDHHVDQHEVAGVMTFLDSRLEVAVNLRKALKAPLGLESTILALKSKAEVQRLIPEFSPFSIIFDRAEPPLVKIKEMITPGSQVIIKPSKLAGAIGARVVSADQVDQIPQWISESELPEFLDDGQWVCQHYLKGPLYSAEGYVKDGQIRFLGLSNRSKVGFTESRIEFPVGAELSTSVHQSYRKGIASLVERSGFYYGFFHIEFIVEQDQAYIIDANMGRLGGGPLGEIIPLSFEISTEDFYAFVIQTSLNLRPAKFSEDSLCLINKSCRSTLGLCYGSASGGKFEGIKDNGSKRGGHTLVVNNGQNIERMGVNNWSWIGILSLLKEEAEERTQELKICIDGEEQNLCY